MFRLLQETPPYQVIVGTHVAGEFTLGLRLTTKRYKKGAKLLFLFFLRRRPVTTEVEVSVIVFLVTGKCSLDDDDDDDPHSPIPPLPGVWPGTRAGYCFLDDDGDR